MTTPSIARMLPVALVVAVVGLGGVAPAWAAGLLTPADGGTPLAIRDHEVRVVVEDGYAVTTVEQVFHNPHGRDLEAIYSFPVPEKAAVSEFTYWIDGKPVTGEVLAKHKARQVYETEKAAGREAGLAEQDSYKTFDISVWPVRAGGDVRIRLGYIQPTHLDTGIGRYNYPLEEGGVDEVKAAFWTATDTVAGRFSFELFLRTAYPVEALRLPDHPDARITKMADGVWHVHLENAPPPAEAEEDGNATPQAAPSAAPFRLDRDIIVYWRQTRGLPASVEVVPYREAGTNRGTFMMVVTPGDDLKPVTEGRDWVFVLDKSGSMRAKFNTLIEGVSRGLRALRPEDRFRIVVFDNDARDLTGSWQAVTDETIADALRALGRVQPNNGTALFAGLSLGLKPIDADRVTAMLLVTDGVANVGETRARAFLDLVDRQDVRLFTFVMGNSANRPLLDALARESGGTAFSVSNNDDIVGAVMSATTKVGHQALHDVRVSIDGVRAADLMPARLGSVYLGQQLVTFGHYWGDGPAEVTVQGKVSGRPRAWRIPVTFPAVAENHPEVERLWAFAAIEGLLHEQDLLGPDDDRREAVVDIATEYGLVTPETSMVVVREKVFAELGIDRKNVQRLTTEDAARQTRHAAKAGSGRVVAQAPVAGASRPSYGRGGGAGAGAFDPLGLALCVAAAAAGLGLGGRQRRR